jgi:hypothetical protein
MPASKVIMPRRLHRLTLTLLLALSLAPAVAPALAATPSATVSGVMVAVDPRFAGRDIHPVVQALSLPDLNVVASTPVTDGTWQMNVPVGKQYQLRLQTDDDWAVTSPVTVDLTRTRDRTWVDVDDLRVRVLDAGVHGTISGDGLGPDAYARMQVNGSWARGGSPNKVQADGRYGVYVGGNPTTSFDEISVLYTGQAPGEGLIDRISPLNVPDARARFDWTLPSLVLSDAGCVPPGVCTFGVDGSGWMPSASVDFYLVEFTRSHPGSAPIITAPDRLTDWTQDYITSVTADEAGHISGRLQGQTPQPWPFFIRADGAYSIEAIQSAGPHFKAVQPADVFDYPPPAQLEITVDPDGTPSLDVSSP